MLNLGHALDAKVPQEEIDVMEVTGSDPTDVFTTIHTGNNIHQNGGNRHPVGEDLSERFHRYGVLWDKDSNTITWYLDDAVIGTASKYPATDNGPMFLLLNLDVYSWDGNPTDKTPNPSKMQVEYVRVWAPN
jgi:beta-glucanase (GH16 family)